MTSPRGFRRSFGGATVAVREVARLPVYGQRTLPRRAEVEGRQIEGRQSRQQPCQEIRALAKRTRTQLLRETRKPLSEATTAAVNFGGWAALLERPRGADQGRATRETEVRGGVRDARPPRRAGNAKESRGPPRLSLKRARVALPSPQNSRPPSWLRLQWPNYVLVQAVTSQTSAHQLTRRQQVPRNARLQLS